MSLRRYLIGWLFVTCAACAVIYARAHIGSAPLPDAATQAWAYAALATPPGEALPPLPPGRPPRADGPIFVSAYVRGELQSRYVGTNDLVATIEAARAELAKQPLRGPIHRVLWTRGESPLVAVPGLSLFSLVPLHDGLVARCGERTVYLTPDDLLAREAYDHARKPPVPDLTFGTELAPLRAALAEAVALDAAAFERECSLRRIRITPLQRVAADESAGLREVQSAAREHARFILRHQASSGRFTYIYDAQRDRVRARNQYSLARHGGTAFFLAQAAHRLRMPEARAGALRALDFVRRETLDTCGGQDRACAIWRGRVEMGASALSALAAAELLRSGDDPAARELLRGLLAFMRAQQRPDGELMHEYDRKRGRPIDVQRMYYSGEAALALLAGYEALGNAADKQAAERLIPHLTGAAWSFFGSRYFYGEEHWTCQAVARAGAHMNVRGALEFCRRWGEFQARLQYGPGVTPWPAMGAFGVGPVLLPRATTAASRVEALAPIYLALAARGQQDPELRALLERSVGLLLRMRWSGRETHLFADPRAAMGGMPSTLAELTSRVDMVQHAGSALLAWAELLERSR
jgi:hypothetical protein